MELVKLVDPIQIVLSPGAFPDGLNTGDIVRWNAVASAWEVVAEPFEFTEIKLTPKATSTGGVGTVFYDSDDDHVWVATNL
jgi:hypothetical protein